MARTISLKSGYDFKASQILILSLFISVTGLCSIVLSVVGFVKGVYGSNLATGLWCGSVVFVAGIVGIISSQVKRKCSVKVLIFAMCIGLIFATILLALSIYDLSEISALHSTYRNVGNIADTKLIVIIASVIASLEILFCCVCMILCFKCTKKSPVVIKPPSPPVTHRNVLQQYRNKSRLSGLSGSDGSSNLRTQSSLNRYRSPRRPHPYAINDNGEEREFLPYNRTSDHNYLQERMTFLPEDSVDPSEVSGSHSNRRTIIEDPFRPPNRRYRRRNDRRTDVQEQRQISRSYRDSSPLPQQPVDDDVFVDIEDSSYSTLVRLAHKQMLESEYRRMNGSKVHTTSADTKPVQCIEDADPRVTETNSLAHRNPPIIIDEEELPPYSDRQNEIQTVTLTHVPGHTIPSTPLNDDPQISDLADREVSTILTGASKQTSHLVTNQGDGECEQGNKASASKVIEEMPHDDSHVLSYDNNSLSLPMFLKREKHAQNIVVNHPVNSVFSQSQIGASSYPGPKLFQNNAVVSCAKDLCINTIQNTDTSPNTVHNEVILSTAIKAQSAPLQHCPSQHENRQYYHSHFEGKPVSSEETELRKITLPRYQSFHKNSPDVTVSISNGMSKFKMLAPEMLNSAVTTSSSLSLPIVTSTAASYISTGSSQPNSRPIQVASEPLRSPLIRDSGVVHSPMTFPINKELRTPRTFNYPPDRFLSRVGGSLPYYSSGYKPKYRGTRPMFYQSLPRYMTSRNGSQLAEDLPMACIVDKTDAPVVSHDMDYPPDFRNSSSTPSTRLDSPDRALSKQRESGSAISKSPLLTSVAEETRKVDGSSFRDDDALLLKYIDQHRREQDLAEMLRQPRRRVMHRSCPAETQRVMRLEQNVQEEPLYRHLVSERSYSIPAYSDRASRSPARRAGDVMYQYRTAHPVSSSQSPTTSVFKDVL